MSYANYGHDGPHRDAYDESKRTPEAAEATKNGRRIGIAIIATIAVVTIFLCLKGEM